MEITAYLPEAYYARVKEGRTVIRAASGNVGIGELIVTTKSPTIDPRLRTFEIKALLRNPPDGLVPGVRANVSVVLQTRTGLGVPRASTLRRGKERVVFAVKDGRAHRVAVETGLESEGWMEIRSDALSPDMRIVRMGQERLNHGMAVVEVKEYAG